VELRSIAADTHRSSTAAPYVRHRIELWPVAKVTRDHVADALSDSGVGDCFSLGEFGVKDVGAEGRCGHGEDGVDALKCFVESGRVVHVCLDDLDGLGELRAFDGGWVAGDGADLELSRELRVVEDVVDDGAALLAGGTEDCKDLGHVVVLCGDGELVC
jgi:hypothetical protein